MVHWFAGHPGPVAGRGRYAPAGALGSVLLLASACGPSGGRACTEIGAASGVAFSFAEVVTAHPDEALLVRACVGDSCTRTRIRVRGQRRTEAFAGGDALHSTDRLRVSLTVTAASGRRVFQGSTTVTPRKVQPNGAGCPPTVYAGSVAARGGDVLRPRS